MTSSANPSLTSEQQLAISRREVSVALSAGAGCGKTFVLTERFLSHLEPEARPRAELSQLVAITFTDRAAREMRDRVRKKCHQRLLHADAEEASYWLELLRDLDTARISTIHSFCTSILRSNAVEAGLDPRFGVLEQTATETLLAELVDDLLRDQLAQQDESTLALASIHGLNSLKAMLQSLIMRSNESDLNAWQETSAEELVALWEAFRVEHVLPSALRQIASSESARNLILFFQQHEVTGEKMLSRRDTLLDRLPSLAESRDPEEAISAILDAARIQGANKKHFDSVESYQRFKDEAKTLRDEIKKLQKPFTFNPQAALPAAEAGLELLALANNLEKRFEAVKKELRVLDFNDLIRRAGQLLSDPANESLRKRVASQIQLVMVDEFQDTSPAQVTLIRALCGEGLSSGKLFFVGDLKQSIYRFRGANPEVVHSLRQEIPEAGRLPLSRNFRSQPAILDFVNTTFAPAFGEDYETLEAHRPQLTSEPAIEFLWAPLDETERGRGNKQQSRRREADWIARRLRQMIDQGEHLVVDESKEPARESFVRAVQPGDVVLLFRALSDVQHYEEALRRYGLDYYLVGGHAFYAQQEIYDLLNLLRAIADPADEVSLAGVLRSPFFSLRDETLFWLSQKGQRAGQNDPAPHGLEGPQNRGGLNEGLLASTSLEPLEPDQQQAVCLAAQTLTELRHFKDRLPVSKLIQLAIERTAYDAVLLSEFLGERKLANLQKLLDQARSFDQSGLFGLEDFLVQLSQFVAKQPNEPLAATQPETTDVIRLMTIHQAKGLEFPVVVVADLERTGGHQAGSIGLTDQLGPLTRWKTPQGEPVTTGFDLYDFVQREQEEQESVRLFYVACTRAADYLLLSSGIDLSRWPQSKWSKILADTFDLSSGELLAEPPPGRPHPQIRVTMAEPHASQNKEKTTHNAIDKTLVAATDLAASGEVSFPSTATPIPADRRARRQFSYSRLTGQLQSPHSDSLSLEENAKGFDETIGQDPLPMSPPQENRSQGNLSKENPTQKIPRDLSHSKPADPRKLGTLVHEVLEHLAFEVLGNPPEPSRSEEIRQLIRQLSLRASLKEGPETALAQKLVEQFLGSPLATELAQAQTVHREVEFLLAWPPESRPSEPPEEKKTTRKKRDEKNPGEKGGEEKGRFVQGFIDCLYQGQDGQWRILDYKTNHIPKAEISETARQYETQMQLYALAAEQVLGQSPCELILYFLRPDQAHRVPWNAQARNQAIERVTQAIAKSVEEE